MKPSLVRMSLSDPLRCLISMDAVRKGDLRGRERTKNSEAIGSMVYVKPHVHRLSNHKTMVKITIQMLLGGQIRQ